MNNDTKYQQGNDQPVVIYQQAPNPVMERRTNINGLMAGAIIASIFIFTLTIASVDPNIAASTPAAIESVGLIPITEARPVDSTAALIFTIIGSLVTIPLLLLPILYMSLQRHFSQRAKDGVRIATAILLIVASLIATAGLTLFSQYSPLYGITMGLIVAVPSIVLAIFLLIASTKSSSAVQAYATITSQPTVTENPTHGNQEQAN